MDWCETKTNAQKGMCIQELYNITIGKEENPIERLYDIEDLSEKLVNAGMSVDEMPSPLPSMHLRYKI